MNDEKNLREFLEVLQILNQANIEYLDNKICFYEINLKYKFELNEIQNLINSFSFVSDRFGSDKK